MHSDPEHIESYFIQGNPNLPTLYEIKEDIIWSQSKECIIPGILEKTVLALECVKPKLSEFDFVIRTNLSSFYIFSRLLKFLETLPPKKCYSGPLAWIDGNAASGCGIILSSDLAQQILDKKDRLLALKRIDYDDIVLWRFLSMYGISLKPSPVIYLVSMEDWDRFTNTEPSNAFHFRIGWVPEVTYAKLINMFYAEK